MRVAVVVLGDLGRSPRMLNHALSLAAEGHRVELVGYRETELPRAVREDDRIRVWPLTATRSASGRGLGAILTMIRRAAALAAALGSTLLRRIPPPDVILVQTPPAMPTIPVALLAARLRRARVIVDWHNLGWTVLALRLGDTHPLVRLARRLELGFGRGAHGHMCVSMCMAERLRTLGVGDAAVLHDSALPGFFPAGARKAGHGDGRATVVAPMGWTLDDDVALLLDALERYDEAAGNAHAAIPSVQILLSGTGPLREYWQPRADRLRLRRVQVRTVFVPADEYPAMLASAHVGLSLHRSSSGVDLPMKIAEMHAAGLPVLALDYGPCLGEALRAGEDGAVFRTAEELAARLGDLLAGFPGDTPMLHRMSRAARARSTEGWHNAWRQAAIPLLEQGR